MKFSDIVDLSEENQSKDASDVAYSIRIRSDLDKRISNHIRTLKHLENKQLNKRKWLQEAIDEEIQAWQSVDVQDINRDCSLNLQLTPESDQALVKIIKTLKKLDMRMSKSDFFVEAIEKKLSREEKKLKGLFKDLLGVAKG